ncbi:MAG: glycoside hydrolase family 3 C-terminal domain-containing protein [Blautia sp.]|nr:glycoside hydrolase family 3 C-terminal domain-containing protein [Blautia sp.]
MEIERLIAEMTLEEKASLLSGADFWNTKGVERLGIPQVMVSDGPHGLRKQDTEGDHLGINDSIKAVCFPAACASAASFDREVLRQIGESVGDACQHENLSVILGPAVNIKRSPLCGRNFEYFSEDPYLTGELAASLIEGVQSRNIGTSIKHFAANSQEHRRMSSDSIMDERTLREIYLPAFETAVKKTQPWTVMCSYNKVNGEFASQNEWLLTEVLRREWGFEGFVVSDWGAVSDRVKGVAAGLDLEMPGSGGSNDRRIVEAVKKGELSEEAVDESVRRILRIIDRYLANRKPDTPWDMEAQHVLARKLAGECMVLLKNEDQILPLKQEEKVAVIGRFAAAPRYQGGGSSHINSFRVDSLMDALKDNPNVLYAQGYDIQGEEPDEELISLAEEAAGKADKAVIVAGLPDSFESEGYDRSHMRIPRCQEVLIRRVAKVNPDTVVVLYNGSPVEMPWIGDVKGLIEAYLGGQAAGSATKDVLWGDVAPSGRLPESFPLKLEHNPSYLSYGGEGNKAVYTEGIFVGYRYYDKKKMDVLFPFGYGLSYTTFAYENLKVEPECAKDTDTVRISVEVTNTGACAGKEVVQLYVKNPKDSRVFRPVRELRGIEKIFLQPGETKQVSFTLDSRAFAYWNESLHDWYVEDGVYDIEIGKSSRDIVLGRSIKMEGTKALPAEPVTVNTIFMDLEERPEVLKVIQPMIEEVMGGLFGSGKEKGEEKKTDMQEEAVSDEMGNAMLRYLPLRGMVSFSGGKLGYDELAEMLKKL